MSELSRVLLLVEQERARALRPYRTYKNSHVYKQNWGNPNGSDGSRQCCSPGSWRYPALSHNATTQLGKGCKASVLFPTFARKSNQLNLKEVTFLKTKIKNKAYYKLASIKRKHTQKQKYTFTCMLHVCKLLSAQEISYVCRKSPKLSSIFTLGRSGLYLPCNLQAQLTQTHTNENQRNSGLRWSSLCQVTSEWLSMKSKLTRPFQSPVSPLTCGWPDCRKTTTEENKSFLQQLWFSIFWKPFRTETKMVYIMAFKVGRNDRIIHTTWYHVLEKNHP